MEYPLLRPGDEFATRNPMALGAIINLAQAARAVDNESCYSHTGVIKEALTPETAMTLESLWTVKSQPLWEAYRGCRVLVVRNINMQPAVYIAGFEKIRKHIGQWYPAHRLLLHAIGLAKWIHWDRIVCSELTAKFETGCAEFLGLDRAAGFLRNYYGVNPDNLVDRWKESRYFETVFEGVVE
ncbi:MAG: hypothetical protein ACYC7J_18425 [Syntrophales bacterium]